MKTCNHCGFKWTYNPTGCPKCGEPEGSGASSCSAFWAAGWSRLLDKKLAEYRANGSEGEFQRDPIPYRAGAAGGRCAREASERRVAILKQNIGLPQQKLSVTDKSETEERE